MRYESDALSTGFLVHLFIEAVNPLTGERQGSVSGRQYGCGIYHGGDQEDRDAVQKAVEFIKDFYEYHLKSNTKVSIRVEDLAVFVPAEEGVEEVLAAAERDEHDLTLEQKAADARAAVVDPSLYYPGDPLVYLNKLTKEQFSVTQKGLPETEFENEYYNVFEPGIYVDVITGEPLFSSKDKFKHEDGYPCFSKPIDPLVVWPFVNVKNGKKLFRELHSRMGDTALGFLFKDGPEAADGKRYLVFSGAMRFIPEAKMEEEGYGYSLSNAWEMMGYIGSPVYDIFMDNIRVPKANLIGGIGNGFKVLKNLIAFSKLGLSASYVGNMERAYELAVKYAKEKIHRDKAISKFPTIQTRIADIAAKCEASKYLVYHLAEMSDDISKRDAVLAQSALVKAYVSDTSVDVCHSALAVMGAYGPAKEYEVERCMRDAAQSTQIEGVVDMQRIIFGRWKLFSE